MPVSEWHPIKTYLLLRPIDPNQGKTLYAPESAAQTEYARAQECAVIDKGPLLGAEYAIGQRVFVAAYKGARVEIDGEELLVVDAETDVLLAHQLRTICILCEQGVKLLNTGFHVGSAEPCAHKCVCGLPADCAAHTSMHPDSHDFTPRTE